MNIDPEILKTAIEGQRCSHCGYAFGVHGPDHHCKHCRPVRLALAGKSEAQRAPAMLDSRAITMRLPKLKKMVKDHVLHIEAEGRPPKDDDHYIFECALKVFYGDDIFDWYNEANTGE